LKSKKIIEKYTNDARISKIAISNNTIKQLKFLEIKYAVRDDISIAGLIIVIFTLIIFLLILILMDLEMMIRNVNDFLDVIRKPFEIVDILRHNKYFIHENDDGGLTYIA
jgi:hypothetical protein